MIKRYFLSLITCTCFYLLAASFTSKNGNYEVLKVTAPFPMQPIKVFIYPDKDFIITDFGAVNGGRVDNTKAITSAIEACNQSGGGRVVVPAGTWLTGPIHFKSNVNLYLEENAVLNFTDNPSDYLPKMIDVEGGKIDGITVTIDDSVTIQEYPIEIPDEFLPGEDTEVGN